MNEEKEIPESVIAALVCQNRQAGNRLNGIDTDVIITNCEQFKGLAGSLVTDLQMVSGSTVDFLKDHGAKKLEKMPVECFKIIDNLKSVKDYLVEILNYLD